MCFANLFSREKIQWKVCNQKPPPWYQCQNLALSANSVTASPTTRNATVRMLLHSVWIAKNSLKSPVLFVLFCSVIFSPPATVPWGRVGRRKWNLSLGIMTGDSFWRRWRFPPPQSNCAINGGTFRKPTRQRHDFHASLYHSKPKRWRSAQYVDDLTTWKY